MSARQMKVENIEILALILDKLLFTSAATERLPRLFWALSSCITFNWNFKL